LDAIESIGYFITQVERKAGVAGLFSHLLEVLYVLLERVVHNIEVYVIELCHVASLT
jgi:hypothetical protein